jgi:hypothetical protein
MKRFMTKRVAVVGAVAGLVLGLSGAAFAYWTTSGDGGGQGTVATSNGTVTLVASFQSGALTPGGSVPVTISAYNTGSTNLYVTSVVDGTTPIAVSSGCNLGDFSLSTAPSMDTVGGTEIPAGTASTAAIPVATDTLSYANTNADQSGCEGGTVTLSYTSS